METIEIPVEDAVLARVTEIKQVSVSADSEIDAVNELLAEGWRLVHIAHLSDRIVYVLARPVERGRRRAGFLA